MKTKALVVVLFTAVIVLGVAYARSEAALNATSAVIKFNHDGTSTVTIRAVMDGVARSSDPEHFIIRLEVTDRRNNLPQIAEFVPTAVR